MIVFGVLLLSFVFFLVWRHVSWKALSWPAESFELPRFQAHRGYWIEGAGENTLGAFRAAQLKGYQMSELDVHLSSDGIPVVFHDLDFKRVAGSCAKVSDLTLEQMQSLHPLPTLLEVLQSGDVTSFFNIELKTQEKWAGHLERAVVEVIKQTNSQTRVLFSSFNPLALWRLKKLLPEVPRALLATQEEVRENNFLLRNLCLAPYVGVHLLHLDHRYVASEDLQSYRQRGIPVALWTVNEEAMSQAYLEAGAASIISDRVLLQ